MSSCWSNRKKDLRFPTKAFSNSDTFTRRNLVQINPAGWHEFHCKRHRYGWVVVCRRSLHVLVKSRVLHPIMLCSTLWGFYGWRSPSQGWCLCPFYQNGWGGLGFGWHWVRALLVTCATFGCFVVIEDLFLMKLYREHSSTKCAPFSTTLQEQKWHNLLSWENRDSQPPSKFKCQVYD